MPVKILPYPELHLQVVKLNNQKYTPNNIQHQDLKIILSCSKTSTANNANFTSLEKALLSCHLHRLTLHLNMYINLLNHYLHLREHLLLFKSEGFLVPQFIYWLLAIYSVYIGSTYQLNPNHILIDLVPSKVLAFDLAFSILTLIIFLNGRQSLQLFISKAVDIILRRNFTL